MFFRGQSARPDRLELRFGVASPRQWASGALASPAKLLRNLDDDFESPQLLLKEALFQIRALNRTSLAAGKRLKVGASLQQRLWPTFAAARDVLRKNEDGVPEPLPERELLDMADQVIGALGACHLLAVEADYRPEGKLGRAEQTHVLEGATRFLELAHLQQRLRALRFQPLPASAWQAANTLFCALCRAGLEGAHLPALCDDRLLLDQDGTTTPLRIYRMIQALGLFDTFGWSKRRQRFLDSYCAALPDALTILYQGPNTSDDTARRNQGAAPGSAPDGTAGGTPGSALRFSHAYHDGAPTRTPSPGAEHRILIDCDALARAVRDDKEASRQQRGEHNGPTATCIAGLPPLARRPMLRAMQRSLELGVPPFRPAESEQVHCDFRLETGLERISRHLQTVFTGDPAKRAHLQHNAAFSGRSASQGDNSEHADDSQWIVLIQTEQHTVVRTKETRYTKPIALGAVAAYGIGEEGFMRPLIGEVARIVRLDGGQLIVGLTRRARFATLVNAIATLGGESDSNAATTEVPCLLAYDDALGWCLLASQRSSLPVGCPIQLRTRKIDVATRLRQVRAITPHFMLFELDEMNPRLGTPAYPSARRRHRHSRIVVTSQLISATEPNDEPHRRRRKTG